MASDKERREVAARMRKIMRDDPHGWLDMMVAKAVVDVMGEGVTVGETLADLIDRPTCEDVSVPRGDGFTPYVEFKCSACGCSHVSLTYVYYCPRCGAEVIDDD